MAPNERIHDIENSASSALDDVPVRAARFRNRQDAGRHLAARLGSYAAEDPIVLAPPGGGVPVGYEVAQQLRVELDVLVVRKVGVPWHREVGVGAISEGGHLYISPETVAEIGLSEDELAAAVEKERTEVDARVRRFRGRRLRPDLGGRSVILVDDGIATGHTVRAALQAIHADQPREVVLAVAVASAEILDSLAGEVDWIACSLTPPNLGAIGLWYEDFRRVDDDEVVQLLEESRRGWSQTRPSGRTSHDR